MNQLDLLVLFGGMAEEHPISIKSATQLARWLDAEKYRVHFVYITREGAWRLVTSPTADLSEGRDVVLCPGRTVQGLLCMDDYTRIPIDVVFPMLHGHHGEDGAIQGLLELTGIPYVGCGIAASALCMDKSLAYLAAMQAGIPVPRHWVVENGTLPQAALPYPVFVKPARSGSSFGVTKVSRPAELPAAIRAAQVYDSKVLIEEAVRGCEIGCALLGSGDGLTTGEIDQIELSGGFFRVHQEKQPEKGSENSVVHVPANIPEELRRKAAETAKTLYRAIGCRGLARVDMFLLPDGTVMLNEINTMPGFTSYSRYPRMMQAAGLPMETVVDRLIADARAKA